MALRYSIRKDRTDRFEKSQIIARVSHAGKTFDTFTGIKVLPSQISIGTKGDISIKNDVLNYQQINQRLKDIKFKVDSFINQNSYVDIIELKKFTAEVFGKTSKNEKSFRTELFKAMEDMIHHESKTSRRVKAASTIKSKKNKLGKFLKFAKDSGIREVNEITIRLIENYKELMYKQEMRDTTIYKYLYEVRQFIKWCGEREVKLKIDFEDIIIPSQMKNRHKDNRFLEKDEIKLLFQYKPNSLKHDRVKDIFIFQMRTGQRIGDVLKIKRNDIQNEVWTLCQEKTKKKIQIRLDEYCLKILEKYKLMKTPLPRISQQRLNDYLKELFEEAGIDRIITQYKTTNGRETVIKNPFYKVVSSHVARHTFVSDNLSSNVPSITIANQTGQTLNTVETYAKTSLNETYKIISEAFQREYGDIEYQSFE